MKKLGGMRLLDVVPMALTLALAAVMLLMMLGSSTGTTLRVHTPFEDRDLSLSIDGEYVLTGHDALTVTLRVADGTATVTAASCPDRVCAASGTLSKDGDSAVCLPAGIVITVINGETDVDAVAR